MVELYIYIQALEVSVNWTKVLVIDDFGLEQDVKIGFQF